MKFRTTPITVMLREPLPKSCKGSAGMPGGGPGRIWLPIGFRLGR
jgi:hypothetical protein